MTGAVLYALAIGYLLGSIPFGLVVTRLAGKGDIRAIGSGNIGATNVLRTGSRKLAALTLLLDAAKGAVAVLREVEVNGGDIEAGVAWSRLVATARDHDVEVTVSFTVETDGRLPDGTSLDAAWMTAGSRTGTRDSTVYTAPSAVIRSSPTVSG